MVPCVVSDIPDRHLYQHAVLTAFRSFPIAAEACKEVIFWEGCA